jgi:hypothetical protein
MSTCPNCKAALSCSCQKRVASDGKTICASCLSKYEKALTTTNPTGATAPTNVNVFYKAP